MQHATRYMAAVLAGVFLLSSGCGNGDNRPTDDPENSPPAEGTENSRSPEQPENSPPPEEAKQYKPVEDIDVLCGTSFRFPMEKLVELYEEASGSHVALVFGGSEDHLPKVKLKATGDVYVTHTPYMQYTREADALLRQVDVGFLAPVLVVRKGNPKGITRFEDLGRSGVAVVLPDEKYSTCGQMVFKLLEKKGIKEAVLANVGNDLVRHHSIVGNHLKLGVRDAGIMWNGVAHGFRDAVEIVPGPYEYDETIQVAVMGLSYSKRREAVQQFLDFVEIHGRKVFAQFGYVK